MTGGDEGLFRTAFDVAPVGMALIGLDGLVVTANRSACELLGSTEAELVGCSLLDLADGDHVDEDTRQIARCVAGRQRIFTGQRRVWNRTTGAEVWVDVHLGVLRAEDGTPQHLVVHIVDVTARRLAIRATAVAEARFAAMIEHGNDLIALSDIEGRLLYASPAYRTVLGLDPTAWKGQELLDRVHPDDRPSVVAAGAAIVGTPGATASLLMRYQHEDGSWRWLETTITNRLDHPGIEGFVVNSHDVTAHLRAADLLRHQATHDQLTGLPNRTLLTERLAEVVAARRADEEVAVLYVDVDRFKSINDGKGHAAGDALLVEVAARLRATVRRDDMVARLGGDEFVVVAVVSGVAGAYQLAEATCRAFSTPFDIEDEPVAATASIGLATSAQAGDDITLLQAADLALYEAKAAGRNCWINYLPGVTPQSELPRAGAWPGSQLDQLMAHLPAQIPTAIAEEQLVVGYQPSLVVDGRTRKVDAVVRWQHPTLGMLLPGAFTAAVARSRHVGALTGEVLRQACRQVTEWRAEGMPDLEVAVAVSRAELLDQRIVDRVRRALATSGLPAHALRLETAEPAPAGTHPQVRRTVERLRELGVRVDIADTDAAPQPTLHAALV